MESTKRLLSLDVFRGITIAGMILVNNPGAWRTTYAPLLHADWHGCTPTDWVFPFFLFIVGVAVVFALGKRKAAGVDTASLARKVIIRGIIIFGIGLFMAAFPSFGMKEPSPLVATLHYILLSLLLVSIFVKEATDLNAKNSRIIWGIIWGIAAAMAFIGFGSYDFSHLRIPGVLQRIALVYLFCGLLFLRAEWKTLLYTGIGLLLAYWALMALVPVPDGNPPNLDAETNIGAWLDRIIFSSNHLYSAAVTWDPEGLLSTLPAFVTGISGMLTGLWLKTNRNDYQKVVGLLGVGVILIALASIWDLAFPINKKIWTSSYVLYTSGVALLFLGVIYWIVDILGYKWWTKPFVVYGMNALFVYIMSGLVAKLLGRIQWATSAGTQSLSNWIHTTFFTPYLDAYNASLAYALLHVAFFWLLAWVLYKRKVFIKV